MNASSLNKENKAHEKMQCFTISTPLIFTEVDTQANLDVDFEPDIFCLISTSVWQREKKKVLLGAEGVS